MELSLQMDRDLKLVEAERRLGRRTRALERRDRRSKKLVANKSAMAGILESVERQFELIGKGTSAFSTAFTYPQPFPPPPPPAPVPAAHRHATPHTLQHHPEAAVQRQARPSTSSAHPPERYRPATARKAPRIPSPPEERRPATSTHDKGWARSNAGREILGKWVHSRLQGVDGRGPVMVAKRVEIAYPIDDLSSTPPPRTPASGENRKASLVRGGAPYLRISPSVLSRVVSEAPLSSVASDQTLVWYPNPRHTMIQSTRGPLFRIEQTQVGRPLDKLMDQTRPERYHITQRALNRMSASNLYGTYGDVSAMLLSNKAPQIPHNHINGELAKLQLVVKNPFLRPSYSMGF